MPEHPIYELLEKQMRTTAAEKRFTAADWRDTPTGPIALLQDGQWYSVNGTRENIVDVRYKVDPPSDCKMPIYTQDEVDCPDGMYLALFHGRDTKDEDMDDWGFNGPLIGPLRYVHTTYVSNVKIGFADAHKDRAKMYGLYGNMAEDIFFRTDEGLLEFDGKFYGDWTVFTLKGGVVVQ